MPDPLWCVAQLDVERLKPLKLCEHPVSDCPDAACAEAEALERARGEPTPCRTV